MEHSESKDHLAMKKKLLDERAPGLFEFLSKITQGEASTEATSMHSENDIDEDEKHKIHIPITNKTNMNIEEINLSNVVKLSGPSSTLGFQLPSGSSHPPQTQPPENSGPSFEEMQRARILQIVSQNTFMLNTVLAQQEKSKLRLRQCMEEIKAFKSQINEGQKTNVEKIEQLKEEKKHSAAHDNNPTAKVLFNHLFGSAIMPYKYELVLASEIPNPIFKERNLVIKVVLKEISTQEVIKNQNKILLQLGLQTWEVPSNPILRNKTGNKAIMGDTEIELKNGEALFERLQINEVTSKFIHGHVAMIIIPAKPINYGTSLMDHSQEIGWINYELIKPLMLEKITVKSKKKKKNVVKEEESATG